MKKQDSPISVTALLVAFGVVIAAFSALGQAPVISSFSQNGQLICTNLQPGSTASVEWASSPAGPWTNNWAGLDAVTVDSNGMLQVSVPMYYRVRGISPAPVGMAFIPAGSFAMGDPFNDIFLNERPVHSVYVSSFFMDKYEVTKAVWNDVYVWALNHGYSFDNPGNGKATNHPIHTVNWYDAVKWCNARSEKEGRTPAYYTSAAQTTVYRSGTNDLEESFVKWNTGYRLPTEAEWEKAARGGASGRRFPWSDADTIAHSRANYFSEAYIYDVSTTPGYHPTFASGGEPYTSPVGYFAPNGFGVYDVAGGVWEHCWDKYGLYTTGSQIDPHGPATGSYRVFRGGSWRSSTVYCRTSYRNSYYATNASYSVGFRSVLPQGQ